MLAIVELSTAGTSSFLTVNASKNLDLDKKLEDLLQPMSTPVKHVNFVDVYLEAMRFRKFACEFGTDPEQISRVSALRHVPNEEPWEHGVRYHISDIELLFLLSSIGLQDLSRNASSLISAAAGDLLECKPEAGPEAGILDYGTSMSFGSPVILFMRRRESILEAEDIIGRARGNRTVARSLQVRARISADYVQSVYGPWPEEEMTEPAPGSFVCSSPSLSKLEPLTDANINSQSQAARKDESAMMGEWMVTASKNELFNLYATDAVKARRSLLDYADKLAALGALTPELGFSILRADKKDGDDLILDRLIEYLGYESLHRIALHEKLYGVAAPGVVGCGYSAQRAREKMGAAFDPVYHAGGISGKVGKGAVSIFSESDMYEDGIYDYS